MTASGQFLMSLDKGEHLIESIEGQPRHYLIQELNMESQAGGETGRAVRRRRKPAANKG